mmetsp:Transcript_33383/g.76219  ORF Transcript_33383/g.76219 Transcript_33383/m.76219 type:complete len:216 (-) Transcript_33383:191-838(-)
MAGGKTSGSSFDACLAPTEQECDAIFKDENWELVVNRTFVALARKGPQARDAQMRRRGSAPGDLESCLSSSRATEGLCSILASVGGLEDGDIPSPAVKEDCSSRHKNNRRCPATSHSGKRVQVGESHRTYATGTSRASVPSSPTATSMSSLPSDTKADADAVASRRALGNPNVSKAEEAATWKLWPAGAAPPCLREGIAGVLEALPRSAACAPLG